MCISTAHNSRVTQRGCIIRGTRAPRDTSLSEAISCMYILRLASIFSCHFPEIVTRFCKLCFQHALEWVENQMVEHSSLFILHSSFKSKSRSLFFDSNEEWRMNNEECFIPNCA